MGCMDGYFWNYNKNNCTPCAYACLTCEGNENRCTSCPNGYYKTVNEKCEKCETFYKDAMKFGSSGSCLETLGDGKNFGLHHCDDGNTRDGDGCSSLGTVEPDYVCTGGYPYSKDNCTYVLTELIEVTPNKHNDVILKFSRPVIIINGTLT